MPITQEQARAELARRGISPPTNQSGITREQAIAELQRRGIQPPSPPIGAINQSFPQQTQGQGGVTQAMKDYLMASLGKELGAAKTGAEMIGAASAGGLKGLLDVGRGMGEYEAKLADLLTGSHFAGKAPVVNLPQQVQSLLSKHPYATTAGEIVGETAPMMALPGGKLKMIEGAISELPAAAKSISSVLGRMAKGTTLGAAIAPVYAQGEDLADAMQTGAIFGLGGAVAEPLLGAALKAKDLKGKILGGTKTKEQVKKVMETADRLGINMPLAETIGSSGAAKLQKSILKNIPGSGMSQAYSDLVSGLQKNLMDLKVKLNPENVHAGDLTKEFASNKYKNNKDLLKNLYQDVSNELNAVSPGDIHKNTNLFSTAKDIQSELMKVQKLPGGKIKVPSTVQDFIAQVEKGNMGLSDAMTQDELINEYIGDARAKAIRGDAEGRRENRYFSKLKEANLKDIDLTIKDAGTPEIAKKWSDAKEFYKQNILPFEKKKSPLGKIIDKDIRGDEVISTFLKRSGQQPKTQILEEVTRELPQDVKNAIAHNYLMGPGEENLLGMIDQYEKLQPRQRSALFNKSDKQKLDDLLSIKRHIGKNEFNQMFIPDTGSRIAHGGIPLALYGAGTASGGPIAGLATLLAGIGAGRAGKSAVMSDAFKRAYLKSLEQSNRKLPQVGKSALVGLPISYNQENN